MPLSQEKLWGGAMAVATKMVSRPTNDFVDSLIGSIGSLYLTIISFALIYSYISMTLYLQSQTLPALIALDKLLLLRDLSGEVHLSVRDAKVKDLPNFFDKALLARAQEKVTPKGFWFTPIKPEPSKKMCHRYSRRNHFKIPKFSATSRCEWL
jgi:hypothetical protein